MSGRSPARLLAPLALVAAVAAVAFVATSANRDGDPAARTTPTTTAPSPAEEAARTTTVPTTPRRRFYTVQPGDTPSGIAEKTGVGLDTLLELNPDLDPQTLSPGSRLRLRAR